MIGQLAAGKHGEQGRDKKIIEVGGRPVIGADWGGDAEEILRWNVPLLAIEIP